MCCTSAAANVLEQTDIQALRLTFRLRTTGGTAAERIRVRALLPDGLRWFLPFRRKIDAMTEMDVVGAEETQDP